jgi:hypothetical protein
MSWGGIQAFGKNPGTKDEQDGMHEDAVSWLDQRASSSPCLLPPGVGVVLLALHFNQSIQ